MNEVNWFSEFCSCIEISHAVNLSMKVLDPAYIPVLHIDVSKIISHFLYHLLWGGLLRYDIAFILFFNLINTWAEWLKLTHLINCENMPQFYGRQESKENGALSLQPGLLVLIQLNLNKNTNNI